MLILNKRFGGEKMMMSVEKKEDKKTISIRLFEQEDEALRRIKDKYGITKSEVVETLIKKYAKEEYGAF